MYKKLFGATILGTLFTGCISLHFGKDGNNASSNANKQSVGETQVGGKSIKLVGSDSSASSMDFGGLFTVGVAEKLADVFGSTQFEVTDTNLYTIQTGKSASELLTTNKAATSNYNVTYTKNNSGIWELTAQSKQKLPVGYNPLTGKNPADATYQPYTQSKLNEFNLDQKTSTDSAKFLAEFVQAKGDVIAKGALAELFKNKGESDNQDLADVYSYLTSGWKEETKEFFAQKLHVIITS